MEIRTVEEYWPGQKNNLRTARIEIWLEGEHWPMEVGRITADKEIFDQVRDLIETEDENDYETLYPEPEELEDEEEAYITFYYPDLRSKTITGE